MMNRLRPGAPGLGQAESFTGRKKVTLAPGHSLMDWIRLGRAQGDLSGVAGNKRPVTSAELALHNTPKDIWMAIRGKAYNLTPYMEYHPGGVDELMRAAGKDGTELFDEIHNWVNVDSMLEKCFIGPVVAPENTFRAPAPKPLRTRQASVGSTGSAKPGIPAPSSDWYQSAEAVTVVVYSKWPELTTEAVIVTSHKGELMVEVVIKEFSFFIHVNPHKPLSDSCTVSVVSGKVQVTLRKVESGVNWPVLGEPLKLHQTYPRNKNLECRYHTYTCVNNKEVTHDTRLLTFRPPAGLRMITPVGHHLHIKNNVSGMEIARSYTVVVPSLTRPEEDPEVKSGQAVYLMIKSYKGGVISPWICNVKPGDKVQMSNYDGNFDVNMLKNVSHLVMFSAGTGFTSMIRVIRHALFNMSSSTFPVKLVFFNKTLKDILWKEQLDALAQANKRFSVSYVLSQETDPSWTGLRGRVNSQHMDMFVPKSSNPLLLICGQWAYNDSVECLAKIHGLQEEHIYIFSQNN
ncbi:cytochrome b5 reductase 4 [Aplysia californica]|uniref:Cytochrome b5 reductase 4 n=1 Tax=Aplysia californica TaxID=6500 RepID=A0ABM1A778_APLCA|nr:cytochrome b5 reductase 4 [Aplysia californica]